jgi:hypothetical protein
VTGEDQGRSEQTTRPSASGTIRPAAATASKRGWEDHNTGVRRVVPDLSSTPLEAAKGFYGDLLGLRPVTDHDWIVTLADPGRPGAQISLMTHDAPLSSPMSRFRWMTWTPATRQRSRRARRLSAL